MSTGGLIGRNITVTLTFHLARLGMFGVLLNEDQCQVVQHKIPFWKVTRKGLVHAFPQICDLACCLLLVGVEMCSTMSNNDSTEMRI